MRKRIIGVVFLFVTLMLVAPMVFAGGRQDGIRRYRFSTSNIGGTWYTMAGGIHTLFNSELGDRWMLDFIASGGSVENTRRLALGEADITLSYDYHIYEARRGEGIMQGQRPSTRPMIMFEIYDSTIAFITVRGSGINSMQDLQGRRVVLGPPGSGSSDNSRKVLEALGITVIESELAFADAARAVQDGQADALGMSGHPASGVVELANSRDILIIPFTESDMARILREAPFFFRGVLEANTYRGQTEDVVIPGHVVYLIASSDMSEDAVYAAMEVFFSTAGRNYLNSVHRQFRPMREGREGAALINAPFHPGAERYWNERR